MNSNSKLKKEKERALDHILGSGESTLDLDLSNSNSLSNTATPDILLEVEGSNYSVNFSDLDNSKALIKKPHSDVTVRGGKSDLYQMRDNQLLDTHDFQERKIVHPSMDRYEILNAYREIRTKIIHESGGRNLVIMVVSLQHGMGTTFNSVNLAAAFSYEGEKTSLIVDCDINNKKLNNYFPNHGEYGLTDYLYNNDIETEKIIYPTGISRMRYVPVGSRQETAGEYFSSERMRNFIGQIKKRYSDRYIILNAPPVEVSVDAAILSEVSDFIIFILPYGKISNDRLCKALKLIPKEKVIGFVINNKVNHV